MTRRHFLVISSSFVGTLAGCAGKQWRRAAATGPFRSAMAQHLAEHFSYLTLDEGTAETFVRAYESNGGSPEFQDPRVRSDLHMQFLMSTDFFQNGADETRALRFVALYDPYITPCYNPLASFD
jgi:hypothetical protein